MEESEDSSSFENPERRSAKLSGQCDASLNSPDSVLVNLP